LRLVRPARVGSGGDRTEGSRFEIEFRCQRGDSSSLDFSMDLSTWMGYNPVLSFPLGEDG
jgi:hypothetical protein